MGKTTTITSVLGALVLFTSTTAWACSAVGPNKHVGMLLNIDKPGQSFTVLDAETNRPITFLADEALGSRAPRVRSLSTSRRKARSSGRRASSTKVRHADAVKLARSPRTAGRCPCSFGLTGTDPEHRCLSGRKVWMGQ
jgi:hypothetical protein